MTALLEQAYLNWLMENQEFSPEEVKETLSSLFGRLFPSNSWHIAKDTIVFYYHPYSIASYAVGETHLIIPAEKLQGIVREEILQAAKEWNDGENSDYKNYLPKNY